mmetsp:Transcript_27970/g.79108  ORF Transcript_27970/g.79108 Transcript_27970/m.79108 type:complete len:247 (-) Transcript_27970:2046-2786(-)
MSLAWCGSSTWPRRPPRCCSSCTMTGRLSQTSRTTLWWRSPQWRPTCAASLCQGRRTAEWRSLQSATATTRPRWTRCMTTSSSASAITAPSMTAAHSLQRRILPAWRPPSSQRPSANATTAEAPTAEVRRSSRQLPSRRTRRAPLRQPPQPHLPRARVSPPPLRRGRRRPLPLPRRRHSPTLRPSPQPPPPLWAFPAWQGTPWWRPRRSSSAASTALSRSTGTSARRCCSPRPPWMRCRRTLRASK